MGAKTTTKLRLRGAVNKCDLCGRKLSSLDTLKAHKRSCHSVQKKQQPKLVVSKTKAKTESERKSVKSKEDLSKNAQLSTPPSRSVQNVHTTQGDTYPFKEIPPDDLNAVEYECPKCFRTFCSFFSCLKHIQKYHCVNNRGVKVAANSPYLIQPVHIELCKKCNRKVHSIQTHICDMMMVKTGLEENMTYTCTACSEEFNDLRKFDNHVMWMHGDNVESMFFPTNVEFNKWKEEMETHTKVEYEIVDSYDSKCFYHCSYNKDEPNQSNTNNLCPSTIIIQEYTKGIQVHFYKNHYKHCCVDYKLENKYKKFYIQTVLKGTQSFDNKNNVNCIEDDMYMQFKTTMESIVSDAAKVDVQTLKHLLGKALDMTKILSKFDEDIEARGTAVNKSMTDSEITQVLEESKESGKRKLDLDIQVEVVPATKRLKNDQLITSTSDASSPKIINAFSLANNENALKEINNENNTILNENVELDSNKDDKKSNNKSNSNSKSQKKSLDSSLSSFSESYTDFLSKNFSGVRSENKTSGKKKKVYFRKINNAREKNENNQQNITEHEDEVDAGQPDITEPGQNESMTDQDEVAPNVDNNIPNDNDSISTQGNENVSDDNSSNLLKVKSISKQNKITNYIQTKSQSNQNKKKNEKKHVVKTKIGHFTKNTSPKKVVLKPKPKVIPKKPTLNIKPKVDVKYEIQERKDDCNILILKI